MSRLPSPHANSLRSAALLILAQMGPSRRRRGMALAGVTVLAAAAEMVSIAAALRFVGELTRETGRDVLAPALALAGAALLSAILRLLLLRMSQTFATNLGHEVGVAIFDRLLRQPYPAHAQGNSSDVLSGFEKIQMLVTGILLPLVQAASGLMMALALLVAMLLVSPGGTALAFAFLVVAYAMIALAARGPLAANSAAISSLSKSRIKAVQEALGAIRDIVIDRTQAVFVRRFAAADRRFRTSQAANMFLAAAPRHCIEAAGLVAGIAIVLLITAADLTLTQMLPVLAALGLGAQRLLPLIQQVWSGWSQVRGNRHSLADVVRLLSLESEVEAPSTASPPPFERAITFKQVSFARPDRPYTVHALDLTIPRGERLGIAGPSGSGKSTLLDLLMGLLEPTSGSILIDGAELDQASRPEWRRRVAHVPQSVFLLDDTVAANIAFAEEPEHVDAARLHRAARLAQIDGFVDALPEGFASRVGERGVRLSGGERQRIGLARAFYKDADLLVLDEATSALDAVTEALLMNAIKQLDRTVTVIIVSHRPGAFAACDRVLTMHEGRLIDAPFA